MGDGKPPAKEIMCDCSANFSTSLMTFPDVFIIRVENWGVFIKIHSLRVISTSTVPELCSSDRTVLPSFQHHHFLDNQCKKIRPTHPITCYLWSDVWLVGWCLRQNRVQKLSGQTTIIYFNNCDAVPSQMMAFSAGADMRKGAVRLTAPFLIFVNYSIHCVGYLQHLFSSWYFPRAR